VESPLFGHDLAAWTIGEPVQLCTGPGHSHLQFWFQPKESGE
jgi:hypothetical protein